MAFDAAHRAHIELLATNGSIDDIETAVELFRTCENILKEYELEDISIEDLLQYIRDSGQVSKRMQGREALQAIVLLELVTLQTSKAINVELITKWAKVLAQIEDKGITTVMFADLLKFMRANSPTRRTTESLNREAGEPYLDPTNLDVSIDVLNLEAKVHNALARSDLTTLRSVLEIYDRGQNAMLAIRNFGEKSLQSLERSFEQATGISMVEALKYLGDSLES